MEQNTCQWIGVGIDIPEKSELFSLCSSLRKELLEINTPQGTATMQESYHLNLYDLSIPKDTAASIIEKLTDIASKQKNICIKTGKVKYFPFGLFYLEVENSAELFTLHKTVVESVTTLKGECIDKDYSSPERTYSETQKERLAQYGNPHVLDQFVPHITLGMIHNKNCNLEEICTELNKKAQPELLQIHSLQLVSQVDNRRPKTHFGFQNNQPS